MIRLKTTKITVCISGQFFQLRTAFFLSDSSLVNGLLQVRFCSSTCAQSDLKLSKDTLSKVEIRSYLMYGDQMNDTKPLTIRNLALTSSLCYNKMKQPR